MAERLGITGYARNLRDGSVEVLACGSDDALERLAAWLKQGPPMARVDGIEWQPVDADVPDAFYTR